MVGDDFNALLARLGAALDEERDPAEGMRRAAEMLVPALADWCTVSVRDGDLFRRVAVHHRDPSKAGIVDEYVRRFPPAEHRGPNLLDVLGSGRTVLVSSVTEDTLLRNAQSPEHLAVLRGLGVSSSMMVPLIARRETVGVLSLQTSTPERRFEEADARRAEEVGRRLGLAFDNARLYREAEVERERFRFLADASARLGTTLDVADTIRAAAELTVPRWADWVVIDLLRADGRRDRHANARPGVDPELVEAFRRPPPATESPGESALVETLRGGRAALFQEVGDDVLRSLARDPEHLHTLRATGIRSFVVVPLIARSKLSGALTIARLDRVIAPGELPFFEDLARRIAVALDNARLHDELKRSEEAARAADRRKDEFLAMLGHELRNPLSPILTALQLLKLRLGDEAVREREVIERQVRHLARLVDDLLDVSRITRGKVELRRSPQDIADAIAKAIELSGPLLEERRQELSVDVTRDLKVAADPTRLVQVFTNLLNNAAKYTQESGHIRIRARGAGGQVEITFRDDGPGIPTELLPRVFDLFVQGERSIDRSKGGLGLGLTIVRSLVELHGGEIDVLSPIAGGRGTEFRIRLPRLAEHGASIGAAESELPRVRKKGPDAMRVLVVDDNRDAAETLGAGLEEAGFEVALSFDPIEALAKARAFGPRAALLDIGLPVMDGYELALKLQQQPETRDTVLIAVTGYGQESDRRRALEVGFREHLVKPVELGRIVRTVRQLTRAHGGAATAMEPEPPPQAESARRRSRRRR